MFRYKTLCFRNCFPNCNHRGIYEKCMTPSSHSIQFAVSRVIVPKPGQKCLNHTVSEYCSCMVARSAWSHLSILHKSKLSICDWHLYQDIAYHSFVTTVSQLKVCDFSGETFKGFQVLLSAMSATMTQLPSSGEFCKLHYDTIPVQSASANISFYTNK